VKRAWKQGGGGERAASYRSGCYRRACYRTAPPPPGLSAGRGIHSAHPPSPEQERPLPWKQQAGRSAACRFLYPTAYTIYLRNGTPPF
jgi:hypothetical protein